MPPEFSFTAYGLALVAALVIAATGLIRLYRSRRTATAGAAAGQPRMPGAVGMLETLRAVEHAISRTLAVAADDGAAITGVVSTLCERLHWEWGAWWTCDENLLQRQHLWSTPALAQSPLARQRVLIVPAADGAGSRVRFELEVGKRKVARVTLS